MPCPRTSDATVAPQHHRHRIRPDCRLPAASCSAALRPAPQRCCALLLSTGATAAAQQATCTTAGVRGRLVPPTRCCNDVTYLPPPTCRRSASGAALICLIWLPRWQPRCHPVAPCHLRCPLFHHIPLLHGTARPLGTPRPCHPRACAGPRQSFDSRAAQPYQRQVDACSSNRVPGEGSCEAVKSGASVYVETRRTLQRWALAGGGGARCQL